MLAPSGSSDKRPENAATAIFYRGSWFYIDDSDLDSKSTFSMLGQIFGSKEVSRAIAQQAELATGIAQDIYKRMMPVVASVLMGGLFNQAAGKPSAMVWRAWLECIACSWTASIRFSRTSST